MAPTAPTAMAILFVNSWSDVDDLALAVFWLRGALFRSGPALFGAERCWVSDRDILVDCCFN